MQIKEYLKNLQPYVYHTFLNAIKNDELSHAYLLVGEFGTPLKEIAIYLAKSLICDSPNPLACEECLTCIRVDNSQYADIIIKDGSEKTILKEDVDSIIKMFSKTAMENKGKMIYIIHLVENMNVKAVNSLLKFLEEPGKDTYAFLTTQNEMRVLPTIISRSQRLKINLTPRKTIIDNCKSKNLNIEDSELLSYFYNDEFKIEEISKDEDYQSIKEVLLKFISCLPDKYEALFIMENQVSTLIKSKEEARIFFDLLASFFEDIIRAKNGEKIFLSSYDKIINELSSKLNHYEESFLEILNIRGKIDLNLSLASVFEHIAIYLTKENL